MIIFEKSNPTLACSKMVIFRLIFTFIFGREFKLRSSYSYYDVDTPLGPSPVPSDIPMPYEPNGNTLQVTTGAKMYNHTHAPPSSHRDDAAIPFLTRLPPLLHLYLLPSPSHSYTLFYSRKIVCATQLRLGARTCLNTGGVVHYI